MSHQEEPQDRPATYWLDRLRTRTDHAVQALDIHIAKINTVRQLITQGDYAAASMPDEGEYQALRIALMARDRDAATCHTHPRITEQQVRDAMTR